MPDVKFIRYDPPLLQAGGKVAPTFMREDLAGQYVKMDDVTVFIDQVNTSLGEADQQVRKLIGQLEMQMTQNELLAEMLHRLNIIVRTTIAHPERDVVAQLRREYNEAQQAMKAKVEAHGVRDPSD
jgi:hypothetical protein